MPHFDNHGLKGGQWRGRLTDSDGQPARVILLHHGEVMAEARLTADGDNAWNVTVDLPREVLSDGLQTLILKTDTHTAGEDSSPEGHVLARLHLLAGRPLDEDLAAEIVALRAELELVKRELRRFASAMSDS